MGGGGEVGVRCGLWRPESEAGDFLLMSRLEQCWVGPWHFGGELQGQREPRISKDPQKPPALPSEGYNTLYRVFFLVHFDMSLHLCHFPICLVRTWGSERLAHSGDTGGQ